MSAVPLVAVLGGVAIIIISLFGYLAFVAPEQESFDVLLPSPTADVQQVEDVRDANRQQRTTQPSPTRVSVPTPTPTIQVTTNGDAICGVPCTGAAPDEQVVRDCFQITNPTDCQAYYSADFPHRCEWQSPGRGCPAYP